MRQRVNVCVCSMCSDNRLQFRISRFDWIHWVGPSFEPRFFGDQKSARKNQELPHNHKDISVECETIDGDIWKFHFSILFVFHLFCCWTVGKDDDERKKGLNYSDPLTD